MLLVLSVLLVLLVLSVLLIIIETICWNSLISMIFNCIFCSFNYISLYFIIFNYMYSILASIYTAFPNFTCFSEVIVFRLISLIRDFLQHTSNGQTANEHNCSVNNVYCILYTVYCILYTVYCIICLITTADYTSFNIFRVSSTLYIVHVIHDNNYNV